MSLEKEYFGYAMMCERVMQHVITDIDDYLKETELSGQHSPIIAVEHRLKTLDSAKEKCERKGYPFNIEEIKEHILDVAGIRIITLYSDDIYTVVKPLRLASALVSLL